MKILKKIWQLWIILFCLFPQDPTCHGNEEKDQTKGIALEQTIRAFLEEFKKTSLTIQGGAIAILHQDQVIHKATFGHIRGQKGDITSTTLFPLASSSKPVSAALVAYHVKEKQVTYENDLQEPFPKIDARIKLSHLLSHTSGYVDKMGNKSIEAGKNRTEIIRSDLSEPVLFAPGSHYSYSNILFSLVEELILTKTHSSYAQNMRDFLSRIDVKNPGICELKAGQPVAFPHSKMAKSGKLQARELPPYYPRAACSAAGIFFSVDDFAQFAKLMMGYYPNVLSQKELAPLYEPHTTADEILTQWQIHWPYPTSDLISQYGYGWRILTNRRFSEKKLIFHSGFINGVRSFIGLLPDDGYAIVIVTNQDSYFALESGLDFWKRISEATRSFTLKK